MTLDQPLECCILKPLLSQSFELFIAQIIKNLDLCLEIGIFTIQGAVEETCESTIGFAVLSVDEDLFLLIPKAIENLFISLKGLQLTEILSHVVFDVVNIAINLNIDMIRLWSNLAFDACFISHKVELAQTLSEHVHPHESENPALLSIWVVQISGRDLTPDSNHWLRELLVLLVENLGVVFAQNLSWSLEQRVWECFKWSKILWHKLILRWISHLDFCWLLHCIKILDGLV